jgi:hypothetical protein
LKTEQKTGTEDRRRQGPKTKNCVGNVKMNGEKEKGWAGVYILENTPPLGGGEISANVIWGKKYEKAMRKKGEI